MNSAHPNPTPAAEEQAALWAARLDGSTLSATDRNALDQWLAEDPLHRTLLSQYCQLSAEVEEQLPELVATGRVSLPTPSPRAAASRRWSGSLKWFVGTALATAAAVSVMIWHAQPVTQVATIATPVAQRQSITLSDGTRIELNARTSLMVENGRAERRVRLTSGEAFFEVAKDRSRPFVVETPAGSVRVTGTSFNVRSQAAAELEVTVAEGSVQVQPGERQGTNPVAPVSLDAGKRLSIGPKGIAVQTLTTNAIDDALAWRRGQIVLDDALLPDGLGRFAHFHGRTFTFSQAASTVRVSGRYSLDDLKGFIADIEAPLNVKVSYDFNGTAHVSLRSER